MEKGDLLRLTMLRGHELSIPIWARVEEVLKQRDFHQSNGIMTLIIGPDVLHLGGAVFPFPSRGWAIYSQDRLSDRFTLFSGLTTPDELYVDQAKWMLLSERNN